MEALLDLLRREPEREITEEELRDLVEGEFPKKSYPTPEAMDYALSHAPEDHSIKFEAGQWVEFLGSDMNWHLAAVKRLVKLAPEDWDFDDPRNEGKEVPWAYFYNVGSARLLEPREVRAPEEACKRAFGLRPWVWQQWAVLRAEEYCRFQEDHQRDFQRVNFRMGGEKLFRSWLNDERNQDFKALFDSKSEAEQEKLIHHLVSPLWVMDEMSKDEDKWNFEEAGLSIYSYLSFLGSGWITALLVLGIQLTVPVLLFQAAVESSERFYPDPEGFFGGYTTDLDTFCSRDGAFTAKVMNLCVVAMYMVRVVPSVLLEFFETVGEADTVSGRLNSLRRIVWHQGDDNVFTQVGFKIEKHVNSVYVALVMSLMMLILFLTDDALEVILNALAIEFVHQLDEDITEGEWFDPGARFASAAAVELQILAVLRIDYLSVPAEFCKEFDISLETYADAMKIGDGLSQATRYPSLANPRQARIDVQNPIYMTPQDRIWSQAAHYARNTGNASATWQFEEPVVNFGVVDAALTRVGLKRTGVFTRFQYLCAWSLWDKILFVPPVPEIGQTCRSNVLASVREDELNEKWRASLRGSSVGARVRRCGFNLRQLFPCTRRAEDGYRKNLAGPYLNFDSYSDTSVLSRFVWSIVETVFLWRLLVSLRMACRRRKYVSLPLRVIEGVFEACAYLICCTFVFVPIIFLVLTIECF